MEHKYSNISFFLVVLFTFSFSYGQQSPSPWTLITKNSVSTDKVISQEPSPLKATYYELDLPVLESRLQNVPQKEYARTSEVILDFPNADGTMENYRIMEYSIMAPELQAKFPEIRSYVGYGLTKATNVVYFSISSQGLHGMKMSVDRGSDFINPYTSDSVYQAFSKSDIREASTLFECETFDVDFFNVKNSDGLMVPMNANDGLSRTFRLAIGTSNKYTEYHGNTIASALAAINTTMTRVNGVFDRELSIRFVLVANNDLLISTAENSIFENVDTVGSNTGIINGLIGVDQYDIGHSFTTGSGGRAYLSSVCTTNKGAGTTGLSTPSGDPFAIDYVSHEIGHQLGATHTFNGTAGNCSGGNRTSTSAYEPGSGSTIMSYAGICAPQNIQVNSSDYFHQISLRQIWNNVTTGNGTCGVLTPTGNSAPVADAGLSYTIPISTPYKLTGASSDVESSATHTYTWEQFDLGPAGMPSTTTEFAPMVRSFYGTSNPVRYIPRLADVVASGGISSAWEKLPSIDRVLNYVLTVRDNDTRGGQTAVDDMSLTAVSSSGPFKVTSQDNNDTWEIGAYKTVTWDVANTDLAPVNVSQVSIKLSTDGGISFPYMLASQVPNTGAHEITVPNVNATTKARILVESVGNIFYNVNTSDFKIVNVDFLLNFSPSQLVVCQPADAVYDFTYNTYQGFNGTTVFSAINLPSGATATFNPSSASIDGTAVIMTISNLSNAVPGTYNITARGTSGSKVNSTTLSLDLFNGIISPIDLLSPESGKDGLYNEVNFTWTPDTNVENYFVEIATTSNFDTIVASHITTDPNYQAILELEKVYYWRVSGYNSCSSGTTSEVYSFSTGVPSCESKTATDTPIEISPVGSNTYISTIAVGENLPVTDVNVKVNITHTKVQDLRLVLISPKGTRIVLANNEGNIFDANYVNTVFDQEATTSIDYGDAPFTGSFKPVENLSILNGELSMGEWKLEVTDATNGNGGNLTEFTLDLCLAKSLSIKDANWEDFAVFPNPNKGEFTIKLRSLSGGAIKIDVYDIHGRILYKKQFKNTAQFRKLIRLDEAPSGLYLLKISDGMKVITKKILVN